MLMTCSIGVIHEFFLALAVNFVIFMAQRPSANIALLREREKSLRELYQIPQSIDGCRDMKMLLD